MTVPVDVVWECPECSQPVTGIQSDADVQPRYETVEMWPGGPLWTDPEPVGLYVAGRVTTFLPCGHAREGVDWEMVGRLPNRVDDAPSDL